VNRDRASVTSGYTRPVEYVEGLPMRAASCLAPLPWIAFVVPLAVSAQPAASAPCSAPESKQFDFWLGDWKLIWLLHYERVK
jgi:hypothetical protein